MQNTRFKLAEMRTQLAVARSFVDHCLALHVQKKLDPATGTTQSERANERTKERERERDYLCDSFRSEGLFLNHLCIPFTIDHFVNLISFNSHLDTPISLITLNQAHLIKRSLTFDFSVTRLSHQALTQLTLSLCLPLSCHG